MAVETYIVSDGSSSFYAPEDQLEAWKSLGYSVYKQELIPVASGKTVDDKQVISTGSTGVAPEPKVITDKEDQ